eukprot:6186854-Pleurochrysis_carterae.AAC.1
MPWNWKTEHAKPWNLLRLYSGAEVTLRVLQLGSAFERLWLAAVYNPPRTMADTPNVVDLHRVHVYSPES